MSAHATIAAVNEPRIRRTGLLIGGAMLLLITVPYGLAWLLAPEDTIFAGFLANPLDSFSYLAKMKQGQAGQWLFQLPYTDQAGQPTLLFIFYISLGHIVRLLGTSPLLVFHGARLLAASAMAWAGLYFFRKVAPNQEGVHWSFAIYLLGSGLGWLAVPFGWLTSDFLIPESIPLFAASLNPHFPIAYAALALAVVNVLRKGELWQRAAANLGLGLLLGAVQPFAAFSLTAVLIIWLLWEVAGEQDGFIRWRQHQGLIPSIGFALGSIPWLAYQYWLTLNHPVLKAWNQQNQTPSPNPAAYLVGFGVPLALALLALWNSDKKWSPSKRLLVTWLVVTVLLLYSPFNLQRRFSLGLFLPIAALAGSGMAWLGQRFKDRRWLPYVLIALSLPSNLFALAAGVGTAASGSPLLLLENDERAGYQWLAENLNGEPLVLAAPRTGNRLPAYARVRVIYGHPFETPAAETREKQVIEMLQDVLISPAEVEGLRDFGVDYVVIGPHERDLIGTEIEVPDWPLIYSGGNFQVIEVPTP